MHRSGGLRDFVGLCQRGVVTNGDADALLATLEALTGCCGAVITQAFTFESDWARTSNLTTAWMDAHSRHRHQDPSGAVLDGKPLGTPYLVETDTPDEHRGSELHDAMRAHGFSDIAIAKLYSPFHNDLMIALYRFDGAPAFDEEDRAWLSLLLPAASRGLSSRRALAAIAARRKQPEELPTASGHLFISMPSGAVTWSQQARRLLHDHLGFDGATWPRADNMMRFAARRFLASAEGARSQPLPGRLRLELACVPPQRGEHQRLLGWVVTDTFMSALPSPGDVPAETPAEELLTPRQRAVARAAARGATVPEMARDLGLGQETVRSHLREIYRRLAVRDRAQLSRWVKT